MKNRLITLVFFLLGIFLVVTLLRSVESISQKSKIIEDTEKRLASEKERNSQLKREVAKVESPQYIEKEAREKLNLGKEGEYVVILPPITPVSSSAPSQPLSHWEAWMRVFWP